MGNLKPQHADHLRLLQEAGLRSTRQRQAVAALLFDGTHKHLTAEQVHAIAHKKRAAISLATVYNTLHQFTAAGLLHEIVIDSSRIYYDTNTDAHYHFFHEKNGQLLDIPAHAVKLSSLPKPPEGTRIECVDVVFRVRET